MTPVNAKAYGGIPIDAPVTIRWIGPGAKTVTHGTLLYAYTRRKPTVGWGDVIVAWTEVPFRCGVAVEGGGTKHFTNAFEISRGMP